MKIVRMDGVSKEVFEKSVFTGKEVTKQVLVPDDHEFTANIVNFGKGVRTKFHTHDSAQILIVTQGRGIVATEGKEIVVTEGDLIYFPEGEKHWHGATKDSEFSHIFIMKGGYKTTVLED